MVSRWIKEKKWCHVGRNHRHEATGTNSDHNGQEYPRECIACRILPGPTRAGAALDDGSDDESDDPSTAATNGQLDNLLNATKPEYEDHEHLEFGEAVSDADFGYLTAFANELTLEKLTREVCLRCNEIRFHVNLNKDGVCRKCRDSRDIKKKLRDGPYLMSGDNLMDPGPGRDVLGLPGLNPIEQLLIARVHCTSEMWQVPGSGQWKSRAHVAQFP